VPTRVTGPTTIIASPQRVSRGSCARARPTPPFATRRTASGTTAARIPVVDANAETSAPMSLPALTPSSESFSCGRRGTSNRGLLSLAPGVIRPPGESGDGRGPRSRSALRRRSKSALTVVDQEGDAQRSSGCDPRRTALPDARSTARRRGRGESTRRRRAATGGRTIPAARPSRPPGRTTA